MKPMMPLPEITIARGHSIFGRGLALKDRFQSVSKRGLLGAFGCLIASSVNAQDAPLPPKRPTVPVLNSPSQEKAKDNNSTKVTPVIRPAEQPLSNCIDRLASLRVAAQKPIPPTTDNSACKIDDPVQLISMSFKGVTVSFPNRPILDCRAAHTIGLWLRDIVFPLTETQLQSSVASVDTGPGFECRNRNRAITGKLSAHASGLAIDVARITLANKSVLIVAKPSSDAQKQLLETLRKSACGWFTTVLGPGSDAAHADHLHLDVEQRGTSGTSRFCQ